MAAFSFEQVFFFKEAARCRQVLKISSQHSLSD